MDRMIGAIDNSRMFNILGGWTRYADGVDRGPVELTACYQEEIIAQVVTTIMRGEHRCGFSIDLGRDVSSDDLRLGRLKIFAGEPDNRTELTFHGPMLEAFDARWLGKRLSASSDDVIRHFIGGLTLGAESPYLKYLSKAWEKHSESSQARTLDGIRVLESSSCLAPVGQVSPDGVSVVGKGGHLFIFGGSNNLTEAYAVDRNDAALHELAKQWVALFGRRKKAILAVGARYLQVIIPDKSSVLADKFPVKITPPTSLLAAIHGQVQRDSFVSDDYLDCLELLSGDPNQDETFQKTDSHLAAYGCRHIMHRIIRLLGYDLVLESNFSARKLSHGDLGSKFTNLPLLQILKLPKPEDFAAFEALLVQAKTYTPADGNNGGVCINWVNSGAPIDKCVVAFGNSFFERGGGPTVLSWWAARCFREFHFVWDSNMRSSYIEAVRPDVVICQTAERFLRRLPEG